MNTEITYLYRDAHNYKANGAVVVEGEIRYQDIKECLDEGIYFMPRQVGLDALNGYDAIVDHPFHELGEDNFELTEARPTSEITAEQLIENFKQAHKEGWDESYFNDTLRERIRDSNLNFVRIPDDLPEVQTVTVRMQSDQYDKEDFTQSSWQEALECVFRLYREAKRLGDGIERIIGIVLNRRPLHSDVITVYRKHVRAKSLAVRRDDFVWACEQLQLGDQDELDGLTEMVYILDKAKDFDRLKAFLKEKELLIS